MKKNYNPESEPLVVIVILNYKNYEDTIRCLHTVNSLEYINFKVIVVDNDSQNQSLEKIAADLHQLGEVTEIYEEQQHNPARQKKFSLVQARENRGYAAGNNIGLRLGYYFGAEYFLVLNNDTLVEPSLLTKLVGFSKDRLEVGVVAPLAVSPDGEIQYSSARRRTRFLDYFFSLGLGARLFPRNPFKRHYYYLDEMPFLRPMKVDVISGCCFLITKVAIEEVNFLDENTFLMWEEPILAEKLKSRSFSSFIFPESKVVHLGGKSRETKPSKFISQAYVESFKYYHTKYRNYGQLKLMIALFLRGYWIKRFYGLKRLFDGFR